jgi:hypothetical protein
MCHLCEERSYDDVRPARADVKGQDRKTDESKKNEQRS